MVICYMFQGKRCLVCFLFIYFCRSSSCSSHHSVCKDGSCPAVREEVRMENGRSPVLGSSLSECEGTELMEGAAAAVGRQQSVGTVDASFLSSCCGI